MKFKVFWDLAPCSQVDDDYTMLQKTKLHTHHRENLKSHVYKVCYMEKSLKLETLYMGEEIVHLTENRKDLQYQHTIYIKTLINKHVIFH
jgi:hypothetical protein